MASPVAPLAAPPAPPVVVAPAVPPVVEPTGLQKAAQVARQMIADRAAAQATAAATAPDPLHPAPEAPPADPAAPAPEGETPPAEPVVEAPPEEVAPAVPEIVVGLPGSREGEPDLEIVVTDPQVAERLNDLRNRGLRRDELKRQMEPIEAARAERAAFDDAITIDPVGVVMERMGEENRVYAAKALLTDPAVLAALAADELFADTLQWDEGRLALATERMKNVRHDLRDRLTVAHTTRSARQKTAGDVLAALERIPPPSWNEEQAEQFIEDCFTDVKDYISRHGHQAFRIDDLPLVLQRRLRAMGMNPLEVAQRIAETGNGEGRVRPSAPAAAAPPVPPAPAVRPVRTAAELKTAAVAREKAAAIPSGAHGAPVAGGPGFQPPAKGSGLAGAADALKRLAGIRK